jgi:hypothetical protein
LSSNRGPRYLASGVDGHHGSEANPARGRKPNNAKLEALVRQFVQMRFDTSNPTSRRDKPISRNMESSKLSNSLRKRRSGHHSPRMWFS